MSDPKDGFRRPLSRRLVRAARNPQLSADMTIGELIASLGDRSFGWCIVVFALLNLLPLPLGFNLLTSIPLIFVTGQMALGFEQVRLPDVILRRTISRRAFQKLVLRLRPVFRPIERLTRPRSPGVFTTGAERLLGALLFVASVALFFPIPLNTWLLALSLLVSGVGMVERDGIVTMLGAMLAIVAIGVTVSLGMIVVEGAERLAH